MNTTVAPESDPTQQVTVNSFVKDVYVGGFPMNRASLGLEYSIDFSNNTKLWINPVYNSAIITHNMIRTEEQIPGMKALIPGNFRIITCSICIFSSSLFLLMHC